MSDGIGSGSQTHTIGISTDTGTVVNGVRPAVGTEYEIPEYSSYIQFVYNKGSNTSYGGTPGFAFELS